MTGACPSCGRVHRSAASRCGQPLDRVHRPTLDALVRERERFEAARRSRGIPPEGLPLATTEGGEPA